MTNILDTVEPDFKAFKEFGDADVTEFYSRPKVESLLSQCRKEARKEALLEAARMCDVIASSAGTNALHCAAELRRMAEGEKIE